MLKYEQVLLVLAPVYWNTGIGILVLEYKLQGQHLWLALNSILISKVRSHCPLISLCQG